MSFVKRFDDDSKDFRKNLKQTFKLQNQKINPIKSVKEVVAILITSDVKQIEKILIKIIEMLKIDLEKKIENSSKLNQTLNKIESRLFIIKKQNVNQSINAETYANMMKTITKMTKNENEKENIVKKTTTTNMITARKEKKLIIKMKNEIEKKKLKIILNVELLKRIKRITKNFKSKTIELK